jgi:hypothetical protein
MDVNVFCCWYIKGTVSWDFLSLFFMEQLLLVPLDMPRKNFKFCQIFLIYFLTLNLFVLCAPQRQHMVLAQT